MKENSLIKMQKDLEILERFCVMLLAKIENLEKNGVDMIEIGLPFSDPLADGPTIQASSTQALHNGMTSTVLFDQLKDIRKTVSIPFCSKKLTM